MSKWSDLETRFLFNSKRVREAQNKTGSWMSRECGWSRTTQVRYDKGLGSIRFSHAILMAGALGVDPIVLCYRLTDEQVQSVAFPAENADVLWRIVRGDLGEQND